MNEDHFLEFLKNLVDQRENDEDRVGKKLADLSADEIARFESIKLQGSDIIDKMESLKLDMENNDVQRRMWWRAIEQKYKINGNLTIRNGKIHELKKR